MSRQRQTDMGNKPAAFACSFFLKQTLDVLAATGNTSMSINPDFNKLTRLEIATIGRPDRDS